MSNEILLGFNCQVSISFFNGKEFLECLQLFFFSLFFSLFFFFGGNRFSFVFKTLTELLSPRISSDNFDVVIQSAFAVWVSVNSYGQTVHTEVAFLKLIPFLQMIFFFLKNDSSVINKCPSLVRLIYKIEVSY